jgi:endonuclease YncB( thermonuclease family)
MRVYNAHATIPVKLVASALAAGFLLTAGALARTDSQAVSEAITGLPRVIDGDTLQIADTRIRLEGIDAPEASQSCKRKFFGWWACGTAATGALAKLVEGRDITCQPRGLDKYGRMLGVCFAGGQDVNAAMVRQGHAWAFVKYSTTYVEQEALARKEAIGVWQGEAVPPWEYRQQRWTGAEPKAPEGCAIKGNVTKHGKIYHMPWSPWYGQIKMEPDKGKRWFCSEAEALAAGWRPVQTH